MSEQPAFVRCPYCRRKLDKAPKRKSKCPHCGEFIYVRGDDLLRADELEQAATQPAGEKPAKKKASKKKPAAQEHATQSKPKKKPRRKTPKAQGQLAADMKRKKKERYGPDDLLAGLQVLLKVAGALLASGGLGNLLGGLFGGQPAPTTRSESGLAALVQGMDADQLLAAASEGYAELNEEEQFHLRAAVTWLQNGFQLPVPETTA
jgi:hypothetical protein